MSTIARINNNGIRLLHSCISKVSAYPRLQTARSLGTFEREFQTCSNGTKSTDMLESKPGSLAFADCESAAISDLFYQFAQSKEGGVDNKGKFLSLTGVGELLSNIGERPDKKMLQLLFNEIDKNNDGKIHLEVS